HRAEPPGDPRARRGPPAAAGADGVGAVQGRCAGVSQVAIGVEYRFSIPKYLGARAFGKRVPAFTYGGLSALRLSELPPLELPGERWALLKPILSGICGTDLGVITATTSMALEPFSSFPAFLGHEVVARVERT